MDKPENNLPKIGDMSVDSMIAPVSGNTFDMDIEGNNNTQIGAAIFQFPEPIQVMPHDLKELIVAFRNVVPAIPQLRSGYNFDEMGEKNRKNKMDERYFHMLLQQDLPYFQDIDNFLRDPRSNEYSEMYNATAEDLQLQYLARSDKFPNIHSFLAYSYDTIFNVLQAELGRKRRQIRTFLHHMYWNCSIGEK
ncbi:ABC-three component system protein [Maridesulfovibrio zosterae]|uniref:ABC-three component system protein n=1 Tax=Maridesulfovibrio zosterae TaxID=82171 RepID=UPI0004869D38|nr:ABC-three component system protein [Maridesulfovibrio zosterae]